MVYPDRNAIQPLWYKVTRTIYETKFLLHICTSQCSYYCGRPWPAAYINFNQTIHQIQVLTKPLCRAQAIFYIAAEQRVGYQISWVDLQREVNCPWNLWATYSAKKASICPAAYINAISISFSKKLAIVQRPKIKTSLIGKECERTSHQ